MPRDTAPTWCPARPTRCSPLATDGGEPDLHDEVDRAHVDAELERARGDDRRQRCPALSSDSVRVRSARLIDPWCARARIVAASRVSIADGGAGLRRDGRRACSVAGIRRRPSPWRSAQTSFIRAVSRSAPRRELVNTSVERCSATRSTTRSSTCGQIDGARQRRLRAPDRSAAVAAASRRCAGPRGPAPGRRRRPRSSWSTAAGRRRPSGRRPAGVRAPPRNSATASTGRTVADSPIRCAGPGPSGRSSSASRRSSDSARCAPRLVAATAWISSMITVRTPASPARAPDVSTRYSDSGVVMRMSGGFVAKARRSLGGVSPVRMPTVTSGSVGAQALRGLPDADQRRAQVPLDVGRQRLERRDVQRPGTARRGRRAPRR